MTAVVCFDRNRLALDDIVAIARGAARPILSSDPAFRAFIQRGADFLDRLLLEDGAIITADDGMMAH